MLEFSISDILQYLPFSRLFLYLKSEAIISKYKDHFRKHIQHIKDIEEQAAERDDTDPIKTLYLKDKLIYTNLLSYRRDMFFDCLYKSYLELIQFNISQLNRISPILSILYHKGLPSQIIRIAQEYSDELDFKYRTIPDCYNITSIRYYT